MALNLFRKSFAPFKKCSTLKSPICLAGGDLNPTANKLLQVNVAANLQTRLNSSEPPKLGLRKLKLPPFPEIECIRALDVQSFLPSNHKIVKHGDYNFLESADGYVQVYTQGYQHPKNIDARAGYSVFFGENHPLNLYGPVERRQAANHAKLYGLVKVFQQIPRNLFKNVCICVDETRVLTFVNKSLRSMSENSFRSLYTGKLNKDLQTSMELNQLIRTRQDLTLRMRYVPNDIGVNGIYSATRLAIKASNEETQRYYEIRHQQNINSSE